jgi:hypothetical protein
LKVLYGTIVGVDTCYACRQFAEAFFDGPDLVHVLGAHLVKLIEVYKRLEDSQEFKVHGTDVTAECVVELVQVMTVCIHAMANSVLEPHPWTEQEDLLWYHNIIIESSVSSKQAHFFGRSNGWCTDDVCHTVIAQVLPHVALLLRHSQHEEVLVTALNVRLFEA